jgi:hypothetical protein
MPERRLPGGMIASPLQKQTNCNLNTNTMITDKLKQSISNLKTASEVADKSILILVGDDDETTIQISGDQRQLVNSIATICDKHMAFKSLLQGALKMQEDRIM